MDYAAQVRAKTLIVREQFARIGKLPDAPVRPCIPSPKPLAYRNHARLALTAAGRPGYRAAGSRQVVRWTPARLWKTGLPGNWRSWPRQGSAPLPVKSSCGPGVRRCALGQSIIE